MLIPHIKSAHHIQYSTLNSGCFDVHANESVNALPQRTTIVKTGMYLTDKYDYYSVNIPAVPMLLIRARSGLAAKKSIIVMGGEVDADYRGEICVIIYNAGDDVFVIKQGDRIAQARWSLSLRPTYIDIAPTVRGENGFGSTGV